MNKIDEAKKILEALMDETSSQIDRNHEDGFRLSAQYRKLRFVVSLLNGDADEAILEFEQEIIAARDKRI